jgi:hypothetical protein
MATMAEPVTVSQARQQPQQTPQGQSKDSGKIPTEKELDLKKKETAQTKLSPAETTVEVAIVAYGGRKQLELVKANTQEEGTIRLATDQGDSTGKFMLRQSRREKSWQDLLRVDLELTPPSAPEGQSRAVNYAIAFNGASVWSAQNGRYITARPERPEVETAFKSQLVRDYMALLRYKEDGSKLELKDNETIVGLPAYVVELTLPDGLKTKYWLSTKTFRILHLEYEAIPAEGQPSVKFRISYYYTPLRIVQNTLVPSRRVMTQDGKFVQEIIINTVNYSAKFDPEIFQHLQ